MYACTGIVEEKVSWREEDNLFLFFFCSLQEKHIYVYGHCTITGAPQWEKYETVSISEQLASHVAHKEDIMIMCFVRNQNTFGDCTQAALLDKLTAGFSLQVDGNKERVIVPVEMRIGTYEDALSWNKWNNSGDDLLKSSDAYHQGIARDEVGLFFSVLDA